MGILANENAISAGGYQISNSLRFQSASSQYLSRTPASTTNRRTFTWSAWIKKGLLGTSVQMGLFDAYSNGTNEFAVGWMNDDTLRVYDLQTTTQLELRTSAVYRDPSAWYHIVVAVDTTQATASNRAKLYVNGVQVTALGTATYPAQNYNTNVNVSTIPNWIGRSGYGYIDGYQTEINFIDGQALTPSSFGETNTLTGQWVAKDYTGTYGTNGFYLPFSNGTSTTTLGADSSGNGNNWTLTNFTRSAGVSDCWMYDVPSGNGSPSATQPSSNYAVLNPLHRRNTVTYARANLQFTLGAAGNTVATNSIAVSSGKYYCEVLPSALTGPYFLIGLVQDTISAASMTTSGVGGVGYYAVDGTKFVDGVNTAYGATYTSGNLIGVALDLDSSTVTFYKDNVSQGAITIPSGKSWYIAVQNGTGTGTQIGDINFGQRSFAYTPPSGFKALCTANLPASTIVKGNQYMDATLFTATGTTQTVTNASGFSPDFLWLKQRNGASANYLINSVVGANQYLVSNTTAAEVTDTTFVTALNSNGFTLGTGNYANTSTVVAWQWDAGSTTVTNTNGTISSQVRANPTAGFSIVTYTGTGANATVGHGLGVAPKMVIVKTRSLAGENWNCWHTSLNNTAARILLNTTAAVDTTSPTIWGTGGINPTSTTFQVGTNAGTNQSSATYVAYAFAEIAGFSKFGSYTGNGSTDGVFVYTGFKPKYVMTKAYSSAGYNWNTYDSARSPSNANSNVLFPNTSGAEETGFDPIDLLSNGFKLRMGNRGSNVSGVSYIFMAFAENPFSQSNAV